MILKLLDVDLLPQQVEVIHCPGHQKSDDLIALGNKNQIEPQKRQFNDPTSRVLFCGNNLFSHWTDLIIFLLRPKWPCLRATAWTTKDGGSPLKTSFFYPRAYSGRSSKLFIKPTTWE
jgi:hypothetical protein